MCDPRGYAANNIQHAIRPEDVLERRASVVLRHVPTNAPRLNQSQLFELRSSGAFKNIGTNPRFRGRSYDRSITRSRDEEEPLSRPCVL